MNQPTVSIFCDRRCRLGEGPSWDPVSGNVFWFDILGRQMLERSPGGGPTTVHDLPLMASAIASIDAGRQLLVAEDGVYVRDRASGRLTLHTRIEAGIAQNRSNDARVHPSGSMWIGTMPKDEGGPTGAIYWFREGELRCLYTRIAIPNSICFSPDGSIAYFTDTVTGLLQRVACNPANGLPIGQPTVFVDWRGRDGWLDGSVCDGDGVVWNARWGAGAVDAWAPDGRHLRTVDLPARQTSRPAFVGPRADRLVVTSASKGLSEAQLAADPQAGMTFLVDLPVRGRVEPAVLV